MPLITDWDEFTDGFGTVVIDHFTSDPIKGNRSLRLQLPNFVGSAGQTSRSAVMLKEPPHDRDLVMGVIQTLVRVDSAIPRRFGLFCMVESASNPCFVNSACYMLAQGGFSTSNWWVARMDDFQTVDEELFDTGIPALTTGQVLPLQLKWKASASIFGGVSFEVSFGNIGDTDFSNLAVVLSNTDQSGSALLTTNGEGLFSANLNQQQDSQIIWDDTTISETLIV